MTGGGDGTLRLWDPLQGRLLHTLELPQPEPAAAPEGEAQQEQQQQQQDGQQAAAEAEQHQGDAAGLGGSGGEEEGAAGDDGGDPAGACSTQGALTDAPVPLALAASPDGRHVVAAIDGRDELCLLRLDWAERRLAEAGWHSLPGLHLPTCLSFDAGGTLWAAGGPVADDSTAAFLACGRLEGAPADGGDAAVLLAAAPLPDWLPPAAVQRLEAKAGNEAELLAAAAERRRLASQLLQKRKYSLAQLEGRKRRRRDVVAKAAAAAAQAAADGGAAAQ